VVENKPGSAFRHKWVKANFPSNGPEVVENKPGSAFRHKWVKANFPPKGFEDFYLE
jgi:hypothetical protein